MAKENKPCEKKLAKNAKNKTEPFAKQPQPQAKKKNEKHAKKKIIIHVFKETSPLTENLPFCKITHKRNNHLAKKLSFHQKKKEKPLLSFFSFETIPYFLFCNFVSSNRNPFVSKNL